MSPKRPYERPILRMIDLAAEETLAQGCKMGSAGSASGATPCTTNNCAAAGS